MTEPVWQLLETPRRVGNELFWPLPLAEGGGRLWLLLPAVATPQAISLGIGSDRTSPPTQLYFRGARLELHSQVKFFEIPQDIESLFLGVRFEGELEQIAVNYLWIPMGVVTPVQESLPIISAGEFKAPVDARYDRFRFDRTNEVFVRHADTQWRGELREDYKGFSSQASANPLAELDDADLPVSAELVASSQQGYWTTISLQNDSDSVQDIAIMVVTDEGEEIKESRTLQAGQATVLVLNKESAVTGRVKVYAVAQTEIPLTLNIYYNFLLEVAAEQPAE